MSRIAPFATAVAMSFLIVPMEGAGACHSQGRDGIGCGAPAPAVAAGLPALVLFGAGVIAVLRSRRRH